MDPITNKNIAPQNIILNSRSNSALNPVGGLLGESSKQEKSINHFHKRTNILCFINTVYHISGENAN